MVNRNMDDVADPHIVLLGPMGSGKTTVGRIVASHLGWPLVDSDTSIEKKHGMTGRQLTTLHSIDWLHEQERVVFLEAIRLAKPSVIAAAASIADRPHLLTEEAMFLVCLEGDPAVMMKRLGSGNHRRSIAYHEFRDMAYRRQANVAHLANLILDVTSADADTSAKSISVQFWSHFPQWDRSSPG